MENTLDLDRARRHLFMANWTQRAIWYARETRRKGKFQRERAKWSFDDYDVRKKGNHVESYNIHTGEALFEAFDESEAWRDLREEFGVS